jgi:DNA-binding transcriptional LysR family regulator
MSRCGRARPRRSPTTSCSPSSTSAQGFTPRSLDALDGHRFVGPDSAEPRAPTERWLRQTVPAEQIVFRSPDPRAQEDAVLAGAGIGFLAPWTAAAHPDLVEVAAPREEWGAPIWLVTHVDLHRSSKVQALLKALKDAARDWGTA